MFDILLKIIIYFIIIVLIIKRIIEILRIRNPLSIKFDKNFEYTGHGGTRITLSYISLCAKIFFKNNTKIDTNVIISDIRLYTQKEIEFFDFEYENGIYDEIESNPITDFKIGPESKLVYFKFNIKGRKRFILNDIEKYKSIPVIFKIRYSLSPNFRVRKRTLIIVLEKFFDNLIETIKDKNIL